MTITFVGHGYVGLVSATVFADLGNTVWVIGHTPEKVENLKKGIIPIYEPGLDELVKRNVKAKRLLFTLDYKQAIPNSDAVFIAVGTPPKENGEADLSVVFEVAKKIGTFINHYTVVATKSTVPVGTNKKVKEIIAKELPKHGEFDIASVPEFLREGQAISDTLSPDRIVIGTESKRARDVLVELHKSISNQSVSTQVVLTTVKTAEMIKYAANAFLATKISFANAIAHLSELTEADAVKVLEAVGMDKRVGPAFLSAGAGYGGSCFPKDVKALIAIAKQFEYDFTLLKIVEDVNKQAMVHVVDLAKGLLKGKIKGKTVGILGLSFKQDTDDMREAPSISIISKLQKLGAKIKAFDPIAMENAKKIIKNITFTTDSYKAAENADLLIVVTEWNEFRQLDLSRIKNLMKTPNLLDARNIYDPEKVKEVGFTYQGIGRS